VVAGDLSSTDVYVDIVEPGTPVVVSDVDGTLTGKETEEFTALLTGDLPTTHESAPEVIRALSEKGYRVFYLTARPEFLGDRTREFLSQYGYPEGIMHTSLKTTGATGTAAADFKTEELAAIAKRGLVPTYAFGNTDSDAKAYFSSGITPADHRIFYQFDDREFGGRRIESYADILAEMQGAAQVCP
jgi:phosphatidate phosphatase PAH1